jgi:hypothetical protein
MMGRSLLIVGALGTAGVVVAAGLGYGLSSPADAGMPTHIVAALVAILLAMFSHTWILLYLLGTGRMIRDTVRGGGLDAALLAESRRLRRVCYACLVAAAALVMAPSSLAVPWPARGCRPGCITSWRGSRSPSRDSPCGSNGGPSPPTSA